MGKIINNNFKFFHSNYFDHSLVATEVPKYKSPFTKERKLEVTIA
uniref:Uncharacterized protein n=1 Tax=Rhizophora mucronata TaxID=61149 RepID=A0A2P2P6M1_RHIMU